MTDCAARLVVAFDGGGESVFESPAGSVDDDDVAVAEDFEDCGGQDVVVEDVSPFRAGVVAGDDGR